MLFLASKQLLSKKKQTILILLGISFGTMLFVSISGIQLGLREYITSMLLNNTAHVLISGPENRIKKEEIQKRIFSQDDFVKWLTPPSGIRDESKLENYQGWAQRLEKDREVFDYSPRLNTTVMLKKGPIKTNVNLIGTLPLKQLRISEIEKYMEEGKFEELSSGGNKIILGSKVAEDLGVRVSQIIEVVSGLGDTKPFKLIGIVEFGDERTDQSIAYAHIKDVQKLNKTPGRVSEIAVGLNDFEKAEEIATLWGQTSKDKVQDWKHANAMFMEMIRMQDAVRYFIMTAVLVVAGFGVYNVLSIMINEKQKEIAILRSIGYGPQKILELVLIQGFFLGIAGGLIGMLLGYVLCKFVGSLDLGFEIGGSNHLIISYDTSIYMIAFVAAMIAALVASFIPARSASKMTPIDIIRGQ